MDMKRRRPLPPKAVAAHLPLNEGKEALAGGAQAIKAKEGLAKVGERRAAYSDIDYNGHVNNARYVQWIQDIVDNEKLTGARAMRIDINYLSEVKKGENIEFWTVPLEKAAKDEYALFIEGRRDAKSVFRAELRLISQP
jgi:hypothetical protein